HAPPPTHIYTLSLHDALPISAALGCVARGIAPDAAARHLQDRLESSLAGESSGWRNHCAFTMTGLARRVNPVEKHRGLALGNGKDRKSTRLNSSHVKISYAVF